MSANLPVELTRMNPEVRGGGPWGYPTSLLAAVSAPIGGAMGLGVWPRMTPHPWPRGLAQGPWHPCWGRCTLERLRWGVGVSLLFPMYILPDGPPNLGARLQDSEHSGSGRIEFSPNFQIRSTRVVSHDYLSHNHCFFSRNRPPEESLHQK